MAVIPAKAGIPVAPRESRLRGSDDSGTRLQLAALTLWLLSLAGCDDADARADQPPAELATAVAVEIATETEEVESRTISGDVMPWKVLPLVFTVGGRISRVHVEEGDRVAKGDLIAALDATDYRLVRDLAAAQVEALSPHVERAEFLREKQALPEAKLDELNSKIGIARIQRSQADRQLTYARLRAPAEGIILQRLVNPGDMTDPHHPAGILAELDRVKVILPVAQRDLPLFEAGQEVRVTAPELDREYSGRVHTIGYAADGQTRTFPVTLEVANEDIALRAGMIVDAHVTIRSQRGIFVPLDAVSRSLDGRPSILVADPETGRAVARPLKLGVVLGDRVLVHEGLKVGDRVIVRGLLSEDDPVSVVETARPAPPTDAPSAEDRAPAPAPAPAHERTPTPAGGAPR